jgi:hypothetical protein
MYGIEAMTILINIICWLILIIFIIAIIRDMIRDHWF